MYFQLHVDQSHSPERPPPSMTFSTFEGGVFSFAVCPSTQKLTFSQKQGGGLFKGGGSFWRMGLIRHFRFAHVFALQGQFQTRLFFEWVVVVVVGRWPFRVERVGRWPVVGRNPSAWWRQHPWRIAEKKFKLCFFSIAC